MAKIDEDVAFLTAVVGPLCTKPEEIEIDKKIDDIGTLLILQCAKDDIGRLIGKEGETAKALRRILHTYGSISEQKVNLRIGDPKRSEV